MEVTRGIKGMVLAAGFGTRLHPLTENLPKPLVLVAGRPMIHYPLLWMRSRGVREVVINTHYLGAMIERELGDGSEMDLSISYSREKELMGTGGGVGKAKRIFGRTRLVLINADTLIDADLDSMVERHEASGAIATMAVAAPSNISSYTPVYIDEAGLVRSIGGEPSSAQEDGLAGASGGGSSLVNFTGLSILDPELMDYLPEDKFASLVSGALVPAIKDGKKIASFEHQAYWKALDDVERVREAEHDIRHGVFLIPGST